VSGTSARRLDPASSRHTQAGIEGTDSWLASRHGGSIQNNAAIDSAPGDWDLFHSTYPPSHRV
jgi:hypothetical protein